MYLVKLDMLGSLIFWKMFFLKPFLKVEHEILSFFTINVYFFERPVIIVCHL